MNELLFAFGLTLFAGLATGAGAFMALVAKRTDAKFLAVSLGFSAGVMIYVSMIEIFVKAQVALVAELGGRAGAWATAGGFFAGIVLIAAGLLTMLAGIVIGLPTLRLRGDYLAIVTLGFGEIIPQVVRNGDSFGGFNLTNGTFGIAPIDSVGFPVLSSIAFFPENFQTSDNRERWYYLIAFLLLLFTIFCSVRLRDSRLGRAWIAIREDETAAAAMGVPLMKTKTWAYALGAFFGGVAGAYYASFKSGAFPADFYFNISVFLLCMVILGGMGSIWGVILGGMILGYLNVEGLATFGSKLQEGGIDFDPTKYQFGFYGVIIVLMMLFRPEGLIPERRTSASSSSVSTTRRSTT